MVLMCYWSKLNSQPMHTVKQTAFCFFLSFYWHKKNLTKSFNKLNWHTEMQKMYCQLMRDTKGNVSLSGIDFNARQRLHVQCLYCKWNCVTPYYISTRHCMLSCLILCLLDTCRSKVYINMCLGMCVLCVYVCVLVSVFSYHMAIYKW